MEENTKNMLAGLPYHPSQELATIAHNSHRLCQDFNQLYDTDKKRQEIIHQLLGKHGKNTYFQGPIYFDYGLFTEIGDNFYANTNLTVLDTCPVKIGNNVMIGPNCTLATPLHPLRYQQRNGNGKTHYEYGAPITIEDNCWLASNVVVNPGVTIGAGSVIGSGSIITRDVPANSLVVGVPGKVIRKISEADNLEGFPE